MNFKQKLLFNTLDQNIRTGNVEKAQTASELLFNDSSLSKNARKRLKKSFYELSSLYLSHTDYVNSIKNLEFARSITPLDHKLINFEFNTFNEVFFPHMDEFVEEDLFTISAIISLLIEPYKKKKINFLNPAKRIEIEIRKKIGQLLPKASKRAESKLSFRLQLIINSLDPGLSEDERLKKAAEILAPHIIKIYKKKIAKQNEKKKD